MGTSDPAGDVVAGPFAEASTAPIADRDVSAVAAHALLTDELVGQRISLTGPQAMTNTELVDTIGGVLARRLSYREVPDEQVRQRFVSMGFSTEFADAYIALLAATVDRPALVTHDVEKILGRPAESFADAVSANQDLFTNHLRENMSELRPPRYLKPMNRLVKAIQKLGIPAGPAQILTVPGRKSGKLRALR